MRQKQGITSKLGKCTPIDEFNPKNHTSLKDYLVLGNTITSMLPKSPTRLSKEVSNNESHASTK